MQSAISFCSGDDSCRYRRITPMSSTFFSLGYRSGASGQYFLRISNDSQPNLKFIGFNAAFCGSFSTRRFCSSINTE